MKDLNHIKKFNESDESLIRENNSTKDKVVDMYISVYDMDDYIVHKLVVKTQGGKTFYIDADDDSPQHEDQ